MDRNLPFERFRVLKLERSAGRLDVDEIHDEIFTYTAESDSITVYPREANGDVAPIRVIKGPDTLLKSAYGIAVDPINDILVVGLNSHFGTERRRHRELQ